MPPPATHRRAPLARTAIIAVALGALTTVLTSWAICTLAASPSPPGNLGVVVHDPAGPKLVFSGRSPWRAELLWEPDDGFRSHPTPEPDRPWDATPGWIRRAVRSTPPNAIYLAGGWPAHAMHMTVHDTDPAVLATAYEARGGLLLERRRRGSTAAIALPLTPHWPAFALNTAFYAAWWAFAISLFASRPRAAQAAPAPAPT